MHHGTFELVWLGVRILTPGVGVPAGPVCPAFPLRFRLGLSAGGRVRPVGGVPGWPGTAGTRPAPTASAAEGASAAVGLAGATALDLIDALNPGAADTVLVSGATGGVGAFAVQLAAARGARVLATTRPATRLGHHRRARRGHGRRRRRRHAGHRQPRRNGRPRRPW